MRPATPLICAFINAHRDEFGVVPICRAPVVHGVQSPRGPTGRTARGAVETALWDATITEILAGIYEPDPDGKRPPECLYGSLKMWAHLQRQGIPVARCTVEKIMRVHRWRGAIRHGVRRARPNPTRPQTGLRTWSADDGEWPRRTFWSSPTSPTCRWSRASATPRLSSTPTPG